MRRLHEGVARQNRHSLKKYTRLYLFHQHGRILPLVCFYEDKNATINNKGLTEFYDIDVIILLITYPDEYCIAVL